MGHLGRATCTMHLISAQTSQEGIKCTKAKKQQGLTVLIYILWIQDIQRRTFASKLSLCIWVITDKHKTLFHSIINIQNQTKFSTSTSSGKVHIFWEGQKIRKKSSFWENHNFQFTQYAEQDLNKKGQVLRSENATAWNVMSQGFRIRLIQTFWNMYFFNPNQ